jgi:hypothetical protein
MHFGHEQPTPLLESAWTIYRELEMKRGTALLQDQIRSAGLKLIVEGKAA